MTHRSAAAWWEKPVAESPELLRSTVARKGWTARHNTLIRVTLYESQKHEEDCCSPVVSHFRWRSSNRIRPRVLSFSDGENLSVKFSLRQIEAKTISVLPSSNNPVWCASSQFEVQTKKKIWFTRADVHPACTIPRQRKGAEPMQRGRKSQNRINTAKGQNPPPHCPRYQV